MAKRGLRILVRTDVDWGSMDVERFAAQDDPTRPLLFIRHALERDLIPMFRRIYGMDYFEFRGAIQRLAASRLAAVAGARVSVGFADFETWFHDPSDELVCPVDDDDIFHPGLVARLHALAPETELVIWKHAAVGYAPTQTRAGVHRWNEHVLFSNNWGIDKAYLRRLLPPDEARLFLSCHRTAQSRMAGVYGIPERLDQGGFGHFVELEHERLRFLDEFLSLQLFHVGSLSGLWARSLQGADENALRELELVSLSLIHI